MNMRIRNLVRIAFLLAIVTAIFFSMAVSTYAATGIIRTETGKLKRFAYTGSLTTIKTGGAYLRDAGTYSNSMLRADGMPQPSGTVSGNIHYVDRNNNGVLDYGTDTVLYCLQYRKASPSGQSFSTEAYDAAGSANLVAKDPLTYNGLLLILQNGFPVKTAAEMGLPDNDSAFYATASAVRFWLAQRERDLNLFPWHYNFLDLSRGVGTVGPIAGQEAVWNKAVQLRNLAVTNTGQRVSDVTATFVGSDDYRYDWFIYQYRINTANMSGGYQIISTSLPAGSVITGYTGNNGDVLNVHIPFSEANAGKGFSFNVTAYDNAQAGSLEKYLPASSSSYQSVAGFNLKTVSNSKTISVSGSTRAVPDLIVESMTTNKTSYDSGEAGTLTLTVLNRGNGSTGYNSSLWIHTLGKGFTVGNIGSGQRASFSTAFITVPGPYTANTSYTLSASADNGNAVIESNEGNNDGSVSFTILGKPDLTVTSLTTNKSVYEPGETVTITATVLNNSSVACGAFDVRTRSNQLGEMNRVRWTSLAANTSRTYTYSFTAPNNYAVDTVINLDFFVDASFEISEFREDNNSALLNITVKAGKPDLTGSITTNKTMYEAGETVTASITVRNIGPVSVKDFNSQWSVRVGTQPVFAEGQLDQAATSSLPVGGSFTHTVTFTAPSVLTASNLRLDFEVDYDKRIAELDETNNLIQYTFAVNAVRPDLTVTDDNITAYFTDKEVVITATVRNLTLQPVPNATVRLVFGSITLNEQIPIPGNGSNLAVFRVRTPVTAGSYTISMTVDPVNLISESNESNNSRSKSTTVAVENRIVMPDPDTVALEQSFISNGKKLPTLSTPTSSSYHTWQEYRLESGSYVLKNYWMRLTTTFTASPDPRIAIAGKQDVMESGFGLEAFATTSITTNYDRPDKLVGPQMLYAFYPETLFGQSPYARYADSMVTSSGSAGERTISWCYPISPFSTVGSKLHFTPLWIPDGLYPVLAQAFYAWSPVGQVYEYKSDPVTILGDMYDRVTVVRR